MEDRIEAINGGFDSFSFRSKLYKRISNLLANAVSVDEGMDEAISLIGNSLNASRVYIFEKIPEKEDLCLKTFEWCAEGEVSEMPHYETIYYEGYGYSTIFKESRYFCCEDTGRLEGPTRQFLEAKGVKAMMNYAFYDNGQFAGFVGIDDCAHTHPVWLKGQEVQEMLSFLADLLTMFLIKERNLQKARLAAAQNDEFLNLVNELVNSGTWYVDLNEKGHMTDVHWSDSFRHMLGFESEEDFPNALNYWIERIHPEDHQRVLHTYYEGINNCTDYDLKYRLKTKNGNYEWFSVRAKLLRHTDGSPRGLFGTLINITEQEVRLADHNGKINAILGGVKGGLKISYNRSKYPYAYISESVAAIQGYTPAEMMQASGGTAVANGYPEDIAAIAEQMLKDFRETGTYSAKYRVRHKDGHLIWIHDYGTLVVTPQGEEYVYSLIQDIDEEERTKKQLEIERRAYKEALMNGSMVHYVVDLTEGYILEDIVYGSEYTLHRNPDIIKRASYDEQVNYIHGQGIKLLNVSEEDFFSREAILKRFEMGQTQFEYHCYNDSEDTYGKVLVLLYRNDENGHVIATYIHSDETLEKRAENERRIELEMAVKAAKKADYAKSVFLSNMSHDIRTPMGAITGYTSLALDSLGERDKVRDYLTKIGSSANHMLTLINEILEMSRFEFDKIQIKETKVSMPLVIGDIKDIIEADVNIRHLDFRLEQNYTSNRPVWCDAIRMKQIMLNCLNNAVKFTPEHGSILFSITENAGKEAGIANYVFRVKDTGIGMSEEFMGHLFEPFSREQTSTVNGILGTGLGMSITKKLVDLMGGTIQVLSEKNKGTEFIISLPFRLVDHQQTLMPRCCETTCSYCEDRLKGLKVLLVDDNELNREIAAELLSRKDVIVSTASNGAEAVSIIRDSDRRAFDLILMDIQMPVMDGHEASRNIRAMEDPVKSTIPIIALSANAFEEDRQRAYEAGINEHVPKPIDMYVLEKAIMNVLDK